MDTSNVFTTFGKWSTHVVRKYGWIAHHRLRILEHCNWSLAKTLLVRFGYIQKIHVYMQFCIQNWYCGLQIRCSDIPIYLLGSPNIHVFSCTGWYTAVAEYTICLTPKIKIVCRFAKPWLILFLILTSSIFNDFDKFDDPRSFPIGNTYTYSVCHSLQNIWYWAYI